MAFNLYCNGTPSVLNYDDAKEQLDEADSIQWKNCSAVSMPHIFGRQCRYDIRNMQGITVNCTLCLEDGIDDKSQTYGYKERY